MKPPPYVRTTYFAITVICLVIWIAAAGALLSWVLRLAAQADMSHQQTLVRYVPLLTGVLIISVLLLAGVIIHHVSARFRQTVEPSKPTAYEDAWTEAGRRLKPEDAPPVTPYEPEDEDNPPKENEGR